MGAAFREPGAPRLLALGARRRAASPGQPVPPSAAALSTPAPSATTQTPDSTIAAQQFEVHSVSDTQPSTALGRDGIPDVALDAYRRAAAAAPSRCGID